MNRREFLAGTVTGMITAVPFVGNAEDWLQPAEVGRKQYSISYDELISLPEYSALIEEIRKAGSDLSVDDYAFCSRTPEEQSVISDLLMKEQLQIGLFAGSIHYGRPVFSSGQKPDQSVVLEDLGIAVSRTNHLRGKYCSIIPGRSLPGVSWKRQTRNAVEFLKRLTDFSEKHDIVLLLEPVNFLDQHSEMFLSRTEQAWELCERVSHPNCKMLYDFRQQRILGREFVKDLKQFQNQIGYLMIEPERLGDYGKLIYSTEAAKLNQPVLSHV